MQPNDSVLPALATRIAGIQFRSLDPQVVGKARTLMLDTIGCAVAGRSHPAVAKAATAARRLSAGTDCNGLGSGQPYGVLGAILDSGAAIRALDLNDFYWGPGVGGHPSDLFSVVFALAQAEDADLAGAIEAAVAGYEVYLRVVDVMAGDGPYDHTTAMTLSAAAAASRLLALDVAATTDALRLAAVRGPALSAIRYGQISEAKAAAPASAAISGVVAAELARAGIGGPTASLEGSRGLGALARPGMGVESLAAGEEFWRRILDVGIKRFPCIGTAQAAVAAAIELRGKLAGRTPVRIHFRLADDAITKHQTTDAYRRPDRRETADHSFFSLLSLALLDGDVTPAQFETDRFLAPQVWAISDRLEFTCDLPGAKSARLPAEATAFLQDGTTVSSSVEFAPGHPRNPMSVTELGSKVKACTAGRLPASSVDRLIDLCLQGNVSTPMRQIVALAIEERGPE